ncbi:MAG: DUF2752 domain-containing protein [Acidobacteriota bacterium]|nr:DUF2752 domain-containing protein [Acidobacteriota bacterium]MDQ7089013.1 DUF2752 domain-containing protein [Acidobacteriota bacterium]
MGAMENARSSPQPLARGALGPLSWKLIPVEDSSAQWEIVLALVSVAALAAAVLLPLDLLASWLPPCRFHAWTGFACPSCGVTRGLLALRAGKLGTALAWNPLLVGLALAGAVYGLLSWVIWLLRLPRLRIGLRGGARRRAWWLAGAAVLLNWVWLVMRGGV